jgi:hypothetical protein
VRGDFWRPLCVFLEQTLASVASCLRGPLVSLPRCQLVAGDYCRGHRHAVRGHVYTGVGMAISTTPTLHKRKNRKWNRWRFQIKKRKQNKRCSSTRFVYAGVLHGFRQRTTRVERGSTDEWRRRSGGASGKMLGILLPPLSLAVATVTMTTTCLA